MFGVMGVKIGDQVSRRGALTGGYYGNRKSRLELQDSIWRLQEKVEGEESRRNQLKGELESILYVYVIVIFTTNNNSRPNLY